ncbi:RNA-binding protein spenito [Ischnura elegans]|uniref:RNA-binding protein spenito n=1 Tax=Ischnura elegans TaxID=197161 RepID=UPI001ED8A3F8|nr:RNA-binding protein spenito [Ischnura elegans]
MKRSSDRDTPPISKRSRSSIGRYDDSSDERITPDRDRRGSRGRSPGPSPGRGRYPTESSHRDEYSRSRGVSERSYTYKVLCVSALHPKASDEVIKDTLYREYKKFGDISVKISHDLDERLAYVCFRSYEDAREAKHSKPRIILFDKAAIVEAVYESSSRSSSDVYRSRPRSISPEYDRYYRQRSPVIPSERHRPSERYERGYGPPPPGIPHRSGGEFRRGEGGPPPPHHDFIRGPSSHHGLPHAPPGGGPPHHYGPPRGHGGGGGAHGGYKAHFEKHENKKDKFPNYLHHVPPEDDPLATRTLFAGNLEINISDEELRRIFGRYGIVEDIDIKRPPPGTGNAYAFVRYQNLDMAHRAKVELSGQYIGKFQCKIGYGKVTPTTRIWVGGLGPWTSIPGLEREFDRFGAIKKIDHVKGDGHAYILYDSIDAATAAVKEMRGFPLGGPERRLRVDFADVTPAFGYKARPYSTEEVTAAGDFRARGPPVGREDYTAFEPGYETWTDGVEYAYPTATATGRGGGGGYRGRGGAWGDRRGGGRGGGYRGTYPADGYREEDWVKRPAGTGAEAGEFDVLGGRAAGGGSRRQSSRSPEHGEDRSPRSPGERRRPRSGDSDSPEGRRVGGSSNRHLNGALTSARSLPDIARKSEVAWTGALILKNSLFPAKFHQTDGDSSIVGGAGGAGGLLRDEEGRPQLRITQRLRLDQSKLEDVSKRIASSSSHAIFLALSGSTVSVAGTGEDSAVQTRPLRNLVSYLKLKEAAGVITLASKETDAAGVLYTFPPCPFSVELLRRTAPNLSEEGLREDHLVIVVVRGGSA